MATRQGQLNKTVSVALDANNNQYIFIPISSPNRTLIHNINWGYGKTAALTFGFGSLQIIKGEKFNPNYGYGTSPAVEKDLIYYDEANAYGGRSLDFSKPLEIPANTDAVIIVSYAIDGAGAPQIFNAFITVTASQESGKDERGPRPRGLGVY